MQQSVTIVIDQEDRVYFAGQETGHGVERYHEVLDAIPLKMVEKVIVRDERDTMMAQVWEFEQPFEFDSLKEGIEYYPSEEYEVTPFEQEGMRQDEHVYLDHEFSEAAAIHEEPEIGYLPKPRPKVEEPVIEEPEEEEDDEPEIEIVELAGGIPEPIEEPEPEEEEPEPEEEYLRPENAEDVDWKPEHELHRNLSDGEQDEDPMFHTYAAKETILKLPKGVSEHQAYLPGERVENISIADKKARLKVNRPRSKFPLYAIGALAGLAFIFFIISQGFLSPRQHYDAVCVDNRTQLVAADSACQSENENYSLAYVPSEETQGLENLDILPESTVFEEPSGKVEIHGI